MKRWWTVLSARVDALSLRERVFLFVTLLIVCMLLVDLLWLAPVQAAHRQVAQHFAAQGPELQRLRDELGRTSGETGQGRLMREELARVRARLGAVDEAIAALPKSDAQSIPLTTVLVHFLKRHDGLVLVRTATLTAEARSVDASVANGATVMRQGMELTVAGPYAELARYVQTLERSLPALRWGAMRIDSPKQPAELTLQVWLVGGGV